MQDITNCAQQHHETEVHEEKVELSYPENAKLKSLKGQLNNHKS